MKKYEPILGEKHRLHLVLPAITWQKLRKIARRNHRSVTGQILCAIDWSLRLEDNDDPTKFDR